jgi:two-component system, cell cycle sensor histidine kinase DivJ
MARGQAVFRRLDRRVLIKKSLQGLWAHLASLLHDSARDEQLENYRLLAENAADMITRHDESGRVVFASAAGQLFGEPAPNILGNGLFERVHVADRPAYLTALSSALAGSEPTAVQFRIRPSARADTACHVWVEMRCRPVRDPQKPVPNPSGIVAVTRDISDRKLHEAELLNARDEAESASRDKAQLIANVSHELRTSLNAVLGYSDLLDRALFGMHAEARHRDYARLIHQSSEHLLSVLNDILDMSKIEAGKIAIAKEPFDVAAMVAHCCDVMRHSAEQRSLLLIADVASDIPEFSADQRACKQMLLNLIANAIKFTDPGGWVRVSARLIGGNVEFSVADNGIGIAKQDLPKLGNPFVQASNSRERNQDGIGLGLSVVRGLARLHEGRIELASALGEGTTATVFLPYDAVGESRKASPSGLKVSAA